jgi:hypothetical protein
MFSSVPPGKSRYSICCLLYLARNLSLTVICVLMAVNELHALGTMLKFVLKLQTGVYIYISDG